MILSVSRRTDIPNYYSDWFFNRLKEGFLYVKNPLNAHQISKIALNPDVVDCIVFWTKNPAEMLQRLDELKNYEYYFQFTVNGYGKDIEPNLPDKFENIIPTFKKLSEKIGKERVIWRYDPILINAKYTEEYHTDMFGRLAENLSGYTEKVVISFVDLYDKTQRNTKEFGIEMIMPERMVELAGKLAKIAEKNNLKIETCAEQIDLTALGIKHGHCIDRELIERLTGCRLKGEKDKFQRAECGCFESIDIGTYNTCRNGCRYCYANYNENRVKTNCALFDASSPLLCGSVGESDKIFERKLQPLREKQIRLDL